MNMWASTKTDADRDADDADALATLDVTVRVNLPDLSPATKAGASKLIRTR